MQEKQNAVMTLLESSILLSYSQKLDLVDMFPALDERQLDALGDFLATEERIKEEFGEDIRRGVETVLTEIIGSPVGDDNTVYVGSSKAS